MQLIMEGRVVELSFTTPTSDLNNRIFHDNETMHRSECSI